MSSSSFGTLFRLTTFGESHGPAVGVVVDGMPPGIAVDVARVYTSDAVERSAHAGKQIVNALGAQPGVDPLRSAVARVNEHSGIDGVAARRRIADGAIAQSRYPF